MKVQNPHDKFFKETLTKVDLARDFARHYLPAAILQVVDLSTMEPQKDSFIDEELGRLFPTCCSGSISRKRKAFFTSSSNTKVMPVPTPLSSFSNTWSGSGKQKSKKKTSGNCR